MNESVRRRYRRLPGFGRRLLGESIIPWFRNSLWLSEDHLLRVEHRLDHELYRRIYFRDIQYFTIRRTRQRRNISLLLAGFTLPFFFIFLLSLLFKPSLLVMLLLFSPIGGLLLLVLINTFLGPYCEVKVTTSVQSTVLPSLNRLARARQVLARLEPDIRAAQGRPFSGWPGSHPEELRADGSTAPGRGPEIPPPATPDTRPPSGGETASAGNLPGLP